MNQQFTPPAAAAAAIDGDILIDECVQVTFADHPFQSRKRIERVSAGLSVAEILRQHWPSGRPCLTTADGFPVPLHERGAVRPRETVEIVGIPGTEASTILKAVAVVVITAIAAVIAPHLAPIIAPLIHLSVAATTTLVATTLTIAGTLAVNALFPTARPQLGVTSASQNAIENSPTYSIGGGRNESRPYGSVPSVLGQSRMAPLYASNLYTENVGDDQYLRAIFCWGHGRLAFSDIRIGETSIDNFDGVTVENFEGFAGEGLPTIFPAQVFQETLNVDLSPAFTSHIRTTVDNVDEVFVDLVAPNGVFRFRKDNGNRENYRVSFQLEHSPAGANTWSAFQTTNITSSQASAIRRSYRVVLPRGKYDIRVTKISSDYVGPDTVSEALIWNGLRSQRNESPIKTSVPIALTAIRIKATAQLSGVIDSLNGIVQSKVRAWNGSAWVEDTGSSNPADLFRNVLQGSANLRPVADERIDLDALQAWAEFCTAQGFRFNQVRDFETSVWDTLRDIAAAGRAVPLFVDGKWAVVWDDSAAPIVQHFTPANSSGFNGSRGYADPPHGFRVRFANEHQNYRQDERIVYDDGFSAANATEFEAIEFPGVTDPGLIWKHARFQLAQLKLRREIYELATDFEHLVCTRGDRVRVSHDVPKWGLGFGRVKMIAGDVVTLTGDVTMVNGGSYSIRFRLADGSSSLRSVETVAGAVSTIMLVADGAATPPQPGDLFQFGELLKDSIVLRVLAIRPGPDFTARLTLVDDAPEIYDADSGPIPDFDPQISEPIDPFTLPPTGVNVNETLEVMEGGLVAVANLTWSPPAGDVRSFLIQYRHEDDLLWSASIGVLFPTTSARIPDLRSGSYRFRVKAVFADAQSDWGTEALLDAEGALRVPGLVENFRATVSGATLILSWSVVVDVVVRDYEVRHSPALADVSWSSAVPVATGIVSNSITLPFARGTYLIKAVSYRDVRSTDATLIIVEVEPTSGFNVVETISEGPAWGGVHLDTFYDTEREGVILGSSARFFGPALFFNETSFFRNAEGRATSGTYTFAGSIDLGEIFTSRLSFDIAVSGILINGLHFDGSLLFSKPTFFGTSAVDWGFQFEVRTTRDDPAGSPVWSDWENAAAADYTARAFEFRMKLESFGAQVSPMVTAASVSVDMPDRIEAAEDIQSTVSGVTINFTPPYRALKAVNITGQELLTGDYHRITAKTNSGFTVTYYDAMGAIKDVPFDYQAIGYGSVIS